jgi:hypothetical protein
VRVAGFGKRLSSLLPANEFELSESTSQNDLSRDGRRVGPQLLLHPITSSNIATCVNSTKFNAGRRT